MPREGWTGLGYKTVEIEERWREHTGLPHAHFLASASAGLHLAVRLLKKQRGWQDGDEIITTPLTFVSTNHAIVYEGLKPVFADVDEYLCLDPESVAERISPRTVAVMFVGMGGNTGRWGDVRDLARARGLATILDAAHMSGTHSGGKHVGGDADAAVFSFQAVKNLPTADAGMICFAERSLDEAVRKWAWMGINKDTYARSLSGGEYKWLYDVEHPGFKYHGNSIMAAIGLVSLKYLDQDNAFAPQGRSPLRRAAGGAPESGACRSLPAARARVTSTRSSWSTARRDHGCAEPAGDLSRRALRDNTLSGCAPTGASTCPRAPGERADHLAAAASTAHRGRCRSRRRGAARSFSPKREARGTRRRRRSSNASLPGSRPAGRPARCARSIFGIRSGSLREGGL